MDELTLFARRLVEQLSLSKEGVHRPVAVGALRETILPYRKYRTALGIASVEDYETVLLRLVAGERGYVRTVPPEAAERCRAELAQPNPDLNVLDEVADSTVQITSMAAAQIVAEDGATEAAPPEPAPFRFTAGPPPKPAAPPPPPATTGAPPRPASAPVVAAPAPVVAAAPSEPPASREAVPVPGPAPVPEPVEPAMTPSASASCQHQVPAGREAVFCPWCGVRLIPFTCPRCKTELDSAWKHCITCGAPVSDPHRFT
jgi:hypothetical protein